MNSTALADMGEGDLLALAGRRAEQIREAENDLLHIAYQWAIIHDPDRLDPNESGKPGREKARRYGGEGTPEVTEFAAAELGGRIGRSAYGAAALMADALDLHHRHPALMGRVEAGEVRVSYARHVVAKTRSLSKAEARYVDAAVAESADGRIPWSRFELLVEAKVAAAAPEAARLREEQAAKARFAKKTRSGANGMATFMVRADVATIEAIDAAVTTLADRLTETMPDEPVDERRVRAALLLANPGSTVDTPLRDLLPDVVLHLHTYAGGADHPSGDRIARLEGHGPVTESWVRRVLGPNAKFKVVPVIDLEGQAPVDAYEIPDRHRQAVHLMTPADTYPFASNLSRRMQVDHTVPHDAGGASGVGNYGPMTTRHHRIKTHGPMDVKQPFPGIYLWRDAHGGYYVVDHTGTRRVPAGRPTTDRPRPLVLEIYRDLPALEAC
jgi:hypothetical protein